VAGERWLWSGGFLWLRVDYEKPLWLLLALAALVLLGLGLVTLTDAESERKEFTEAEAKPGKAQFLVDPVSESTEPSVAEPRSIDLNERDKTKIAEQANQSVSTAELVKEGRLLYKVGKFAEAETQLKEALKKDPSNKPAFYYLSLVEEAKFLEYASRRGETDTPFPRDRRPKAVAFLATNRIFTSKGAQLNRSKLDRILLQETPRFEGVPLSDVVRFLRDESVKRDPEGAVPAHGDTEQCAVRAARTRAIGGLDVGHDVARHEVLEGTLGTVHEERVPSVDRRHQELAPALLAQLAEQGRETPPLPETGSFEEAVEDIDDGVLLLARRVRGREVDHVPNLAAQARRLEGLGADLGVGGGSAEGGEDRQAHVGDRSVAKGSH
jgi:tetratricopeptide (TPR) repeat protein